MSRTDDIQKLKNTVTIFETELSEAAKALLNIGERVKRTNVDFEKVDSILLYRLGAPVFIRMLDQSNRLLSAYREYVRALEGTTRVGAVPEKGGKTPRTPMKKSRKK